jgi:indole-3-glycerol phosphate synthase
MNLLDRILAKKREETPQRRARMSDFRQQARDAEPTRGFRAALANADAPVSLIAEVKPGSPTRGVIREALDPAEMGRAFASAGAHCLSVLTDVEFFRGAPENLALARKSSGLPCLRKDFVVDEVDVWEARALGADAILLIVNGLSDAQLNDYRETAESLGMDALVEVHSEEEAARAVASGATLIGVNNRDLESFETTLEIGERVLPGLVAEGRLLVSESALSRREDVERVAVAGARAVLIGTAFCEVMGW